ncbi:MgtE intracellular region [Desulfofarcimen acetoxidans DSM 771]|uniref:MgtE intracellular region n=1 Tax=Desulfofarcimen acetoxidans (strain ATCC 49208 / DSM 771 / KCTC 5769 / VKM B-1644 / 5575) TaxID=485916 RepID=C8VX19_DESAS|nr:CBS domain-containing protein [Desulfofarcimen acetoxidans]ACV62595.1 MgtE intracellular region [Desulfofarcimen acetoxidans DSM 771]
MELANGIKILGQFYISGILYKKIVDAKGRKVGEVRDLAVLWDAKSPHTVGIKYAKNIQSLIPITAVSYFLPYVVLKDEFEKIEMYSLKPDEIMVKKWLLDKQIVDIKGSKLVRVNDIQLSWVLHNDVYDIMLTAVDIGTRGLFRRVGAEFLAFRARENLVKWQYLEPIERRTSNIRLASQEGKINRLHPADLADIIEDLDHRERSTLFANLDNVVAAEALAEVDLDTQVDIIEQLDVERASQILEEMAPDELADILGELPEEKSDELLKLMEPEEAEDVRELMNYPDDTAGALMTTEYISMPAAITSREAIEKLREEAPVVETIYYIYIIDQANKLLGVVSLRQLIIAKPETELNSIMEKRFIKVLDSDTHQEVLNAVSKYDLIAVPVTDEENHMLGIVTVDDVIDTLLPDRKSLENFSYFMMRKVSARR